MLQVTDSKVDKIKGESVVAMKDTQVREVHNRSALSLQQIQSVQLMFPQDRNLHGKVFGGILMRLVSLPCNCHLPH
jgi:acyl-coenzyme A thioesterase 9